jgi:hypothetical protein
MAITTAYLAQVKKLGSILDAVKHARAPERFTNKFLSDLGFASTNDRPTIGVLKALGFLDDNGAPTQRYFDFLDEEHSGQVLAQGIRDAYEDLFTVNKKANDMSATAVKGKLKTLLQGSKKDAVLTKMASTFTALCKLADFEAKPHTAQESAATPVETSKTPKKQGDRPAASLPRAPAASDKSVSLGYSINIELPSTRDQQVYDAIFRSLREHLL